jgi:large subunit ribosomal protein L14
MKAVKANLTRGLPLNAEIETCDNSGAKVVKIFSVLGHKTIKGQRPTATIGDLCLAAVKRGRPDMRKQVVFVIIVRQRKEFRRTGGMRVAFEDNSAVVLKDEKGNPKGTIFKGPIAKEVAARWPAIAKVATIIV